MISNSFLNQISSFDDLSHMKQIIDGELSKMQKNVLLHKKYSLNEKAFPQALPLQEQEHQNQEMKQSCDVESIQLTSEGVNQRSHKKRNSQNSQDNKGLFNDENE